MLLAPGLAAGQSYPSSTFKNLTVTNSITVGGYQLTLPATTAPITYQSGSTTPGDCAKWSSTAGALVDGACGSGGGGGLTSFNTRTGPAITLLSVDVTGALGFTPAPLASPTFTGTPVVPGYETTTAAALLAPLASPTFTGTPVVPGYLTTSSAASTYETQSAAALLAPLASPTFTGTPVVPGYLTTTGNGSGLTGLAYSQLPALSANQLLGALTAVSPSGLSVPSCAATGSTLQWTSGSGFSCTVEVGSFNGRTAAVTLSSSDVTTALGFTPLASTGNGSSLTGITYSQLPALSANTLLGALTATTASGQAVPSCSGATNALTWTSGTGFGCNTISGGGGQTAITSGTAILAGPSTTGGQPTTVTVGTGLSFSGGTLSSPSKAYGFANTGTLTAPASTTAYSMAGAGSSCTLTPTVTGRAFVQFSGVVGTGTATGSAVGLNFQIAEGSGTAPANGAAATGTVISPKIQTVVNPNTANASAVYPFSHQAIVTGLTLGTAYWFDEQQESVATAAKFAFTSIVCTEVEF